MSARGLKRETRIIHTYFGDREVKGYRLSEHFFAHRALMWGGKQASGGWTVSHVDTTMQVCGCVVTLLAAKAVADRLERAKRRNGQRFNWSRLTMKNARTRAKDLEPGLLEELWKVA